MRTCCCCFDLRSGTVACAVFTLVLNIKVLVGSLIYLIVLHQAAFQFEGKELVVDGKLTSTISPPDSSDQQLTNFHQDVFLGTTAAVSGLTVLFSVLLLIGVKQGTRGLFLPWLALMGFKVGGFLVIFCILMAMIGNTGNLYSLLTALGILIAGIFYSYLIWCVTAYYNVAFTRAPYHHFVIGIQYQNETEKRNETEVRHETEKDTKPLV